MKRKMKEYEDEKNHASESDVKEGDIVTVKQKQRNKAMSPYDPVSVSVSYYLNSLHTIYGSNNTNK